MKITWSQPAIEDLSNIKAYIGADSDHYASVFLDGIFEAVERLESFPRLGRLVPEEEMDELRELLYHNYRILYLILEQEIVVIAIVPPQKILE